MASRHPSRTVATTVLVVSLVIAVAACGPSSGSAPGSSASASPVALASGSASLDPATVGGSGAALGGAVGAISPAPSVDVAALFTESMRHPFRARASVEGEMRIGSAAYPFTGESTIDGPDNHQTITVAIPGAPERSETMTLGGIRYINRDGLWFEDPKPAASNPGTNFSSMLKSLMDVTDSGLVTKGGQALHHLKPRQDARIPLSAIGMADPGGDGTATFDFFVRDDGTLVVLAMNATWTTINGSERTPVRMAIDYTFSDVGGPVVIERPARVWETFTSKRFKYTLARPSDWEVEQSAGRKKPDILLGADLTAMYVYRFATGGLSLNNATSTYIDNLKRSKTKAKVTSNTATTVDGTRARRLEWTNVYKGTRSWFIEVVVVRGTYVYFFQYSGLEKPTGADRDLVDAFVKSVTLPGKGALGTGTTPSA